MRYMDWNDGGEGGGRLSLLVRADPLSLGLFRMVDICCGGILGAATYLFTCIYHKKAQLLFFVFRKGGARANSVCKGPFDHPRMESAKEFCLGPRHVLGKTGGPRHQNRNSTPDLSSFTPPADAAMFQQAPSLERCGIDLVQAGSASLISTQSQRPPKLDRVALGVHSSQPQNVYPKKCSDRGVVGRGSPGLAFPFSSSHRPSLGASVLARARQVRQRVELDVQQHDAFLVGAGLRRGSVLGFPATPRDEF